MRVTLPSSRIFQSRQLVPHLSVPAFPLGETQAAVTINTFWPTVVGRKFQMEYVFNTPGTPSQHGSIVDPLFGVFCMVVEPWFRDAGAPSPPFDNI